MTTSDDELFERVLKEMVPPCQECGERPATEQYTYALGYILGPGDNGIVCIDCLPKVREGYEEREGEFKVYDADDAELIRELEARVARTKSPR